MIRDILLCVLIALLTYVIWFKGPSNDHSQTGNVPTGAAAPDGALLGNKPVSTPEVGATRLNSDKGQSLEAVSSSRSREVPESDDIPTQEAVESTPKTKLPPAAYTVGWICAISTEHVAAQLFLDEMHEGPEYVSPHDNNDYVLGRVGKHNVAIAVLPDGEYGHSSAAGVGRDMLHSFPNIRIGLMVGIGGGAPSEKHDVRLGDVVVSAPRDGKSGVFQYDFGKTIEGQSFHTTGFLAPPPTVLRAAVNGLKSQYKIHRHQFERAINSLLQKNQRLQHEFGRPELSSDRLYRTGKPHKGDNQTSCDVCCGSNPSILVARSQRTREEDNPAIHYGLIASANSLMKDAYIRDKLSKDKDVLCFEMEAAGLMNHFSCLVIRGICDYSDTHKNKAWQGYAAMVAAAYAKDLLYRIAPNAIETEKRLSDTVLDLHKVVKEFTEAQLQDQERLAKQKLSEEDEYCHQLFRLTSGSAGDTYESYKDRVEERVEDTCLWFVQHDDFQKWLNQKESGVLLISADPGCGKSVLAKYLIDDYLPQSSSICYFFFKDQDQNTTRQALCALLHQLFEQQPLLITHAEEQLKKDGANLRNSTESLWKVFRNAVNDPQAGPITIVLDALDECAESEFEGLMKNIQRQFKNVKHGKLKCILTSRPYGQILDKFQGLLRDFPNIHIPAESESEAIGQEVNLVITYRVNQLLEKNKLLPNTASYLEKRLKETTHRTYLWVYLVFENLGKEAFKNTLKGLQKVLEHLPGNINEAYEQILCKSKDKEMTQKVLSIILAADRPLTVMEMNVAVNIDATLESFEDLDLENEDFFTSRLRFCCGLFVSINQGRIYFLHQTAREFLLAGSAPTQTIQSGMKWYKSITSRDAHAVLAELCVRYLDFFNIGGGPQTRAIADASQPDDIFAFLRYSSESWGAHFREAAVTCDAAIIPVVLRICDPSSSCYVTWFSTYSDMVDLEETVFTSLIIASYFGHYALVELLLGKGAKVDSTDSFYRRTSLSWAAKNGYDAITKLLLDNGAEVNSKGRSDSRTPLSWAAANGHNIIVMQLLGKDAEVDAMDMYRQTPLSWASREGHEAIVKLLLDHGAEVNSRDQDDRTPLSWAIQNNHRPIIDLLLKKGGVIDSEDASSLTPLSWAASKGHYDIVKPLLIKGAEVDYKDNKYGRTPLSWAAENGFAPVVELLLENRAVVDSTDMNGQTPLSLAAENGHLDVVQLLVNNDAEVDSKDNSNRTPLSWTAQNGHEAIIEFLLNSKAAIGSKAQGDRTALFYAALFGHEAAVEMLLNKGAEVDPRSRGNVTPLFAAAQEGHKAVVQLLLKWGADADAMSREDLEALRQEYGDTD